jgi:hypothetical protein
VTILVSAPNQQYNPQSRQLSFSIAANFTLLTVHLLRGDWPDGPCVRFKVSWPTYDTPETTISGGPVVNKDGTPRAGTLDSSFTVNKPVGVTSGIAMIDVLQTISTALEVEAL